MTRDDYAKRLAGDLVQFHAAELQGNQKLRDAIIVKMVALVALAYGHAPVDGPFNLQDTLAKLTSALKDIETITSGGVLRDVRR